MGLNLTEENGDFDRQLRKTPVAIIGMASIFPKASNLPEYWDNILNKINCVTDIPASGWNVEDYYDPDPTKPDKSYCKRGGFIPDIDFDPTEFGLPPNILEVTDVSQLLSLVVARDLLEDAGYGEGHVWNRELTGVILGVVGISTKLYVPLMSRLQYPVWQKVLKASGVSESDTQKLIEKFKLAYVNWEENSFPGTLANVIAGRVANRFDLGGTNCVLDAACATSMAAIKMAIMELVEGRMDMMITGGVDTDNSIGVYMSFSKTPAFSKGESVRTFDAESDGMMAGEGLGMMMLKRLEDAERDGDRIYAVIRGVGSSSDGRFKSIYAPRPSGQAKALRRAYQEAGYSARTVGLVEAHGTGTPAGDPAEFQGMREVFEQDNLQRQYIALGSVKSQIAHTKGAAGAAGMIKAALALYHKILPATINVNRPNPKLDIENSPFYINTETRPWFRLDPGTPRRASVSAFGFGGTNFHITMEEYESDHKGAYRTHSGAQMVILSAPTRSELLAVCQDASVKIQSAQGKHFLNELADLSQTCSIPRENARLGFVAASLQEAQDLMDTAIGLLKQNQQDETWEHPKGIFFRREGLDAQGKVVALFSGQGSQYLEMGRELACNFPPIRQVFSEMDALFTKDGLNSLTSRIYPAPVFDQEKKKQLSDVLTQTQHAQPAIGALSVGLFKLMQQAGLSPSFIAGHSFGELTALWAAGVLNDSDYYFLAKARGKAMSRPDDPTFDAGTMLAVKGDDKQISEDIKAFPEITLANWNSNNQVVLAGATEAIARVQTFLTEKGYSAVQLPVSAAFHTPLVGHAQAPFASAIDTVSFNPPSTRLFSNTTGKAHSSDPLEIRSLLKSHILNPVLFKDEIENIYGEGGFFFIEFGPKNILTNLVKTILSDRPHIAVAMNGNGKKDSDRQFREAVVQLLVAGVTLSRVDPYQAQPKAQSNRKKSAATVKLNGSSFVSPKTLAAFEKTLQDGFKVASATGPVVIPAPLAPSAPQSLPIPASRPETMPLPSLERSSPVNQSSVDALEQSLAQFREHQSEVVRLHQQYLANEGEYGKIFSKLSELEIGLVSNAGQDKIDQVAPIFAGLERSMARFHDHQAETLQVHAQYLKSQEEFSANFVKLVQQQYDLLSTGTAGNSGKVQSVSIAAKPAPLTTQPVKADAVRETPQPLPAYRLQQAAPSSPIPAAAAQPAALPSSPYGEESLTKALLNVVSEKTGYPVEMLDLNTDMEADLGIDSIKRVEIMGALRTQFPNLPKVDAEAFAEVRTLGQIVQYMSARGVDNTPTSVEEVQPARREVEFTPPAVSSTVSPEPNYAVDSLTKALLLVVSEKTGYPVEMLDLNTDMEADLGIDSIKRVEIMGAMRSQFPNLPKVDAEAFAEVRTLGQIVTYMGGSRTAEVSQPALEAQISPHAPAAPIPQAVISPLTGEELTADTLTSALLTVVSEKTGYPVEMLDLNTDMEADLGIDSIKRVEIMGALRSQFPNLPKVDAEAFADVRTLGQIVAYLSRDGSAEKKGLESRVEAGASFLDPAIPRGIVNLKSLPWPDFQNFALPENSICLVTDDGTSTTTILVEKLLSRSWKVVVLNFPAALVSSKASLPDGVHRVALEDLSEQNLQEKLAEISQKFGPISALVHLNPVYQASRSDEIFSNSEKEIIKHVFLLAKHLKGSLTSAARNGKAFFMIVVHMDGEFGLGNEIDFDPISGGLFGLVKTLNLEWGAVYCRAVDISPDYAGVDVARRVVAEIFDPNLLLTEVGYSLRGRTTLVVGQALEEEGIQ